MLSACGQAPSALQALSGRRVIWDDQRVVCREFPLCRKDWQAISCWNCSGLAGAVGATAGKRNPCPCNIGGAEVGKRRLQPRSLVLRQRQVAPVARIFSRVPPCRKVPHRASRQPSIKIGRVQAEDFRSTPGPSSGSLQGPGISQTMEDSRPPVACRIRDYALAAPLLPTS